VRHFMIPTSRSAISQYPLPGVLSHVTFFQVPYFRIQPLRRPFSQYGRPGARLVKGDAWKYMFPSRTSGSSNATQCVEHQSLILLMSPICPQLE
jgi:hypothetical protein